MVAPTRSQILSDLAFADHKGNSSHANVLEKGLVYLSFGMNVLQGIPVIGLAFSPLNIVIGLVVTVVSGILLLLSCPFYNCCYSAKKFCDSVGVIGLETGMAQIVLGGINIATIGIICYNIHFIPFIHACKGEKVAIPRFECC